MGRTARGVRGIRLREPRTTRWSAWRSSRARSRRRCSPCARSGYGKRTPTSDYPTKNRGGKGVITIKTTERNGKVVGLRLVTDDDDLMLITDGGKLIRMPRRRHPDHRPRHAGRAPDPPRGRRAGRGHRAPRREGRRRNRGLARGGGGARRGGGRAAGGRGPGRRGRGRRRRRRGRRRRRRRRRRLRRRRRSRPTMPTNPGAKRPRSSSLFERRAVAVPGRRQLAGARLQGGGRDAGVHRTRRRPVRLRRRRQPLHRLRRFVGPADPGPRRPRRAGRHRPHRRVGHDVRRPDGA